MPKSKRAKVVSLTQVEKEPREVKARVIENIRSYVEEYKHIFVFSFENMRSNLFKDLRIHFRDSRFMLGKNKVMQVALGTCAEDEYRDNLHEISARVVGNVGLLFTNRDPQEIVSYFDNFAVKDFARAGAEADATIEMKQGPLEYLPHTMLEMLRKLGMPVELQKGTLVLIRDFTMCRKGEVLSPEQAKLLKIFGHKLSTFSIDLMAHWSNGKFQDLEEGEAVQNGGGGGAGGGEWWDASN